MITRLTMPKLTPNLNFVAKSEGGYNPCVPRPSSSSKSAYPYRNCVFYAWARMHETWLAAMPSCNAEAYYHYAVKNGWIRSRLPIRGSCIVWSKGSADSGSDGAGHIAVVEDINGNGSIITSESGWSAAKPWWTTTRKAGGRWGQPAGYSFLCFFLPFSPLSVGSTGMPVSEMQQSLVSAGYLRAGEVDGDFGKITLGALCAYQLQHDLTVDGVCGAETAQRLWGGAQSG